MFNGAKLLTVRTLSLDGNAESKDSEPIRLSKSMMAPVLNNIVQEDSIKKKLQRLPSESIQQQQSILNSVITTTTNLLGGNSNSSVVTKPISELKNVISDSKIPIANQTQLTSTTQLVSNQSTVFANSGTEEKVFLYSLLMK